MTSEKSSKIKTWLVGVPTVIGVFYGSFVVLTEGFRGLANNKLLFWVSVFLFAVLTFIAGDFSSKQLKEERETEEGVKRDVRRVKRIIG